MPKHFTCGLADLRWSLEDHETVGCPICGSTVNYYHIYKVCGHITHITKKGPLSIINNVAMHEAQHKQILLVNMPNLHDQLSPSH